MIGRAFLGESRQMVLAAVLRLEKRAYGAAILTEIETRTGRRVSSGSIDTTLDRLKQKGLIRTGSAIPLPSAAAGAGDLSASHPADSRPCGTYARRC